MFYKVVSSEEHISLLRFLWWKDGYLSFLTVFGGVSSPKCSNYALKKTTNDNKLKYGLVASDTLNKNFYVDDILKSVASFPGAITLEKNVRGTCRTGVD